MSLFKSRGNDKDVYRSKEMESAVYAGKL